jgi:Flp pilus assembly protein TadG
MSTGPNRRAGNAVIEFSLIAPWFLFLFAGAFDWGFYAYALISVQNATRVAAQYTSTNSNTATDSATACSYVLSDLQGEPNIGTSVTSCAASPLIVSATSVTGPDSAPAAQVQVTYRTIQLVPIPGLLLGQFTLVRTVVMRIKG